MYKYLILSINDGGAAEAEVMRKQLPLRRRLKTEKKMYII